MTVAFHRKIKTMNTIFCEGGNPPPAPQFRGHFVRIRWYQKLILKAREVRCIKKKRKGKKKKKKNNHELRGILLQSDILNFNVVAQ
jgi:hypothetical protein